MLLLFYVLLLIAAALLIFLICTLELLEQRLKQEAEQRKIDADIEYDSWGK